MVSLSNHVAIPLPPNCHCEERSDVAISLRLSTRQRTIVATPARLPRYARNDKP